MKPIDAVMMANLESLYEELLPDDVKLVAGINDILRPVVSALASCETVFDDTGKRVEASDKSPEDLVAGSMVLATAMANASMSPQAWMHVGMLGMWWCWYFKDWIETPDKTGETTAMKMTDADEVLAKLGAEAEPRPEDKALWDAVDDGKKRGAFWHDHEGERMVAIASTGSRRPFSMVTCDVWDEATDEVSRDVSVMIRETIEIDGSKFDIGYAGSAGYMNKLNLNHI